jgi:hypothetical protein
MRCDECHPKTLAVKHRDELLAIGVSDNPVGPALLAKIRRGRLELAPRAKTANPGRLRPHARLSSLVRPPSCFVPVGARHCETFAGLPGRPGCHLFASNCDPAFWMFKPGKLAPVKEKRTAGRPETHAGFRLPRIDQASGAATLSQLSTMGLRAVGRCAFEWDSITVTE